MKLLIKPDKSKAKILGYALSVREEKKDNGRTFFAERRTGRLVSERER